jgi:hypothetical protein
LASSQPGDKARERTGESNAGGFQLKLRFFSCLPRSPDWRAASEAGGNRELAISQATIPHDAAKASGPNAFRAMGRVHGTKGSVPFLLFAL